MELDFIAIGERIRKYRKKNNLTQKDLAEATDLTIGQISHLETGSSRPTLYAIAQICLRLDVSVDEIIFGERFDPTKTENNPLVELLVDCPDSDKKIILEVSSTLKQELQRTRENLGNE